MNIKRMAEEYRWQKWKAGNRAKSYIKEMFLYPGEVREIGEASGYLARLLYILKKDGYSDKELYHLEEAYRKLQSARNLFPSKNKHGRTRNIVNRSRLDEFESLAKKSLHHLDLFLKVLPSAVENALTRFVLESKINLPRK